MLPIKRNHSKKWQSKKKPGKKLRNGKIPRPSRPPRPPPSHTSAPQKEVQAPAAGEEETLSSPPKDMKLPGQINDQHKSTQDSYDSWSTEEKPATKVQKPTKAPQKKKKSFTEKPKKPFRSKHKVATALRGKLVHSIIHEDKSLEKEIYKTLEASLEKEKEEVTTERSSRPPTIVSTSPFYPTIASKLIEMPAPLPTAATESETESPSVVDQPRFPTTSGKDEDRSYSNGGLRRSMKSRGRNQAPIKKFKKFTSFKKRKPINGAFGAKVEPQTPSADHLIAPMESQETEELENPLRRNANVSPQYGDPFVINYNDQEIKIKPSVVYDTSPSRQSTGSIIKELFSDQLGSRNYQTVREVSSYSPSSTSIAGPTPTATHYSQQNSAQQAVSRNFQTIQEPSSFRPPPPPYRRVPTTSPSYMVDQSTPYYEEITPSPDFHGPTPPPSNPKPFKYRDEALPSYKPNQRKRKDQLPSYSATPAPKEQDFYTPDSQEWQDVPSYSPRPEETAYPKRARVKKQSAPPPESCDCHNVPLSPACSRQCPNIASDRQGLGPQVPIVSQTQEHNQDPAQSHAFE